MKFCLTILINLITISVYSQIISGKVLNEKGEIIPNARIGIENTDIGIITNKNGNYEIDLNNINQDNFLKIIVNEYLPYRIKISEFLKINHNVILKEKPIELSQILIKPKKFKFKNIGTKNKNWAYCGYNSQNKEKLFQEYAIKIKNNKRLKINKININISTFEVQDTVTLIFDIQNSTDGFPDDFKSISDETLKLKITKNDLVNNQVSLDISNKNIWTDEDFFVLVRVNEDLNGKLYFAGNVFAFSKETYYRNYFGKWKSFSVGEPSINLDVQIEK